MLFSVPLRIYKAFEDFTSPNTMSPIGKVMCDGKGNLYATDQYAIVRWKLPADKADIHIFQTSAPSYVKLIAESPKAATEIYASERYFEQNFDHVFSGITEFDKIIDEKHVSDFSTVTSIYLNKVAVLAKSIGTSLKISAIPVHITGESNPMLFSINAGRYGVFDIAVAPYKEK